MMSDSLASAPNLGTEAICVRGRRLKPKRSLVVTTLGWMCLYYPTKALIRFVFQWMLKQRDELEIRLEPQNFLAIYRYLKLTKSEGIQVDLVSIAELKGVSYSHRNAELQSLAGFTALGIGSTVGVYWTGVGIWASPMSLYLVLLGCSIFLLSFISEFLIGRWLRFEARLTIELKNGSKYSLSPDSAEAAEKLLLKIQKC